MDVKISVRPSRESSGCESTSGVLIGASKWVGFDQGSWADWRGERRGAELAKPPARVEGSRRSGPGALTAAFLAERGGGRDLRARDGGADGPPSFGNGQR